MRISLFSYLLGVAITKVYVYMQTMLLKATTKTQLLCRFKEWALIWVSTVYGLVYVRIAILSVLILVLVSSPYSWCDHSFESSRGNNSNKWWQYRLSLSKLFRKILTVRSAICSSCVCIMNCMRGSGNAYNLIYESACLCCCFGFDFLFIIFNGES